MDREAQIKDLALIVAVHHIGCNLLKECDSDCSACAAEAILESGYRKLPEGEPSIVRNPYTTEYAYQCSMDTGMPQGLIVNDDGYVGFCEGRQAQRESDIRWYTNALS